MSDPRASTILRIIAEQTGIDQDKLRPEVGLDELGITSLSLIEAVFEIESHFDVDIPTEGILLTPEVTVGDLLTRVLATLDEKKPLGGAAAE